MKLSEYNHLSPVEKTITVWQMGMPVAYRFDDHFNCCLYQVDDFYIELKLEKDTHAIHSLYGFEASSPQLDMFLHEINLSELLKADRF